VRRIVLVLAMGAIFAGCWANACVVEREPSAADLCEDDVEFLLWDDGSEPGDAWYCSGWEHPGRTCAGLGFTVHCGRFLIRPGKLCDQ
jgi:hypothetical protein